MPLFSSTSLHIECLFDSVFPAMSRQPSILHLLGDLPVAIGNSPLSPLTTSPTLANAKLHKKRLAKIAFDQLLFKVSLVFHLCIKSWMFSPPFTVLQHCSADSNGFFQ